MFIDFSSLFHRSSKDTSGGGTVHIPKDSALWPESWKTITYKSYGHLPTMALGHTERAADLYESIRHRKTNRDFSRRPVSREDLSRLLAYSAGRVNGSRRAHPSGGGRYPLEIYPFVLSGTETLPSGLYHYNIKDHALDILWSRRFEKDDLGEITGYEWARSASVLLVLTAVFDRNQRKYGERGYRYTLIEAGHVGQNVYLNAAAQGMMCCALGGTRDAELEKLLDIDGITESVVYTIALG